MTEKRAYDNSRREKLALLRAAQRALQEGDETPEPPKRGRRRLGRLKRLKKLPPDLKCPTCGDRVTASKSWVVEAAERRGLSVRCRACWNALLRAGPLPPEIVGVETTAEKARREAEGLPPPAVNGSKLPQFIHDLASGKLDKPAEPHVEKPKVDTTSF